MFLNIRSKLCLRLILFFYSSAMLIEKIITTSRWSENIFTLKTYFRTLTKIIFYIYCILIDRNSLIVYNSSCNTPIHFSLIILPVIKSWRNVTDFLGSVLLSSFFNELVRLLTIDTGFSWVIKYSCGLSVISSMSLLIDCFIS